MAVAIQDDAVGAMAEPIQGGRAEHAVGGKGVAPLGEIQVAGEDGGGALVAFGDQLVQVFVVRRTDGFGAEVVDDEEVDARELLQIGLR